MPKLALNHTSFYVVGILLLTLVVRLFRLESFAGFDFDQEVAAQAAGKILSGDLTLIGQEVSIGRIFVGPFYNYVTAFLLLLSHNDPIGIYYFQVFLGVLSTWMMYKIGSSESPVLGIVAASLYTFSFRCIYIDKTAAPSNWLLFMTIAVVYVYTRSSLTAFKKLLITSSICGFATQLHPAGIGMITIPIHIWFTHTSLRKIKDSFLALLFFGLWFVPLIIFDLRHNWLGLQGILTATTNNNSYPLLFRMFQRINLTIDTWITTFSMGRNAVVVVGLLALVYWKRAVIINQTAWVLGLFAGPIIFTIYPGSVPDYYLLPSIIFLLLIVARVINVYLKLKLGSIVACMWLVVFVIDNIDSYYRHHNPYSLKAKKNVVLYIKNNASTPNIKVNFDTDPGQNYGFNYLFSWQQLQPQINTGRPDYVIYVPLTRNKQNPAVVFDGVSVVKNPL